MDQDLLNIPSLLSDHDRIILYALVRGLFANRVLEIGVFEGGSSKIIARALQEQNCGGRLISIDPNPRTDLLELSPWVSLITGRSPEMIPKARELAGGTFDFAFIDGDHSRHGVICDTLGLLEYLSPDSYILYHDAWNEEVKAGIDECVRNDQRLTDCGILSRSRSSDMQWGGMRLLRYGARN